MIYLYIMALADKTGFHLGYSVDIMKAIAFYKSLPTLNPAKMPRLVYLEGYVNKDECAERFNYLMSVSDIDKTTVVATINPDFIELVPGVNIDI